MNYETWADKLGTMRVKMNQLRMIGYKFEWIREYSDDLRISRMNEGKCEWIEENENELRQVLMNWILEKEYRNKLGILGMNERL